MKPKDCSFLNGSFIMVRKVQERSGNGESRITEWMQRTALQGQRQCLPRTGALQSSKVHRLSGDLEETAALPYCPPSLCPSLPSSTLSIGVKIAKYCWQFDKAVKWSAWSRGGG